MPSRSNFASALLAACLLGGCRESAFSAVSKSDTLEGYQRFVREHPADDNVESAKARIAELELSEARRLHTVVAYKRFLEKHADSPQAPAARTLLEGLRYNAAAAKNSAVAWRLFLKDHPDGTQREQAEQRLAAAELREVGNLSDAAQLQRYVAAHSDDERGASALARLDDERFAAARTAAALYSYLRELPAGAHRDQARLELLSLQLQGLLVSGRLGQARALAARAPLAAKLGDLDARFARAAQQEATLASKDEAVRRALPAYYLRSFDDLLKALQAPDPIDRWQAAEELGALVDVNVLDPLLESVRASRHPLVRQRAFESLGRVIAALPAPVAEYELSTRIEALLQTASDQPAYLLLAVLFDLNGRLDLAAPEYQRSFDVQTPDPLVLKRWSRVRLHRKQLFSAAIAARQLALWAEAEVNAETEAGGGRARTLCAALEAARDAAATTALAKSEGTEFPDDVAQIDRDAQRVQRLAEAKLRDAELKLLESEPRARRCGDDSVGERLADAERLRLQALAAVWVKAPKAAPMVLTLAQERDPSPTVRSAAQAAAPKKK